MQSVLVGIPKIHLSVRSLRPKPPVEQRVKVMDTLDKKMQTILEREGLSADKRYTTNRSLDILSTSLTKSTTLLP
jgi:hypothetical protein